MKYTVSSVVAVLVTLGAVNLGQAAGFGGGGPPSGYGDRGYGAPSGAGPGYGPSGGYGPGGAPSGRLWSRLWVLGRRPTRLGAPRGGFGSRHGAPSEAPVPVMGHLREEAPDLAMALLREGATDLVMGLPREGVMVPVTEVRPAAGTAQGTVVVTDLVMAGPGAAMVRTTGTTAPPGAVDQTP
jgi:hypothetical protein